jgi:hypothetical protein
MVQVIGEGKAMSKKAKVLVAAAVAAISFGTLAPAVSARTTIWTQVDRINERLVERTLYRTVPRIGNNVAKQLRDNGNDVAELLRDDGEAVAELVRKALSPR